MVKAVIFDKDGILLDSEGLHFRTHRAVLLPYEIKLSREEYGRYGAGVMIGEFYKGLMKRHRVKFNIEDVVSAKIDLFRSRFRDEVGLRPGILPVLGDLKGHFELAVASNTRTDLLAEQLRHYRLDKRFAHIIGGGQGERRKPYPDLYLKAVSMLGVKPGEVVAIEDTESGVIAAKRAGLMCIAIPHRYSRNQDFSRADLVLTRLLSLTVNKIELLKNN